MTTSTGEDVGKGKDLFPIGGSENSCSHYRSQYGDSSKELVTELLCISAIPLGGTYTLRSGYLTPERLLYSQYLGN